MRGNEDQVELFTSVPEMLGTRQIREIKTNLSSEFKELKDLKTRVEELHVMLDSLEI